MPQVGQDLETARIMKWHVKEGDQVNEGDIVATVESDKASFEVEAFSSGTVLKILFREGEEGHVFKPIAYIGESGDNLPGTDLSMESGDPKQQETNLSVQEMRAAGNTEKGRGSSSPAARRVARENHIDLERVEPSGPDGRVIKRDVVSYAASIQQVRATPLAREIARAKHIELKELNGTGSLGRIRKTDVLNAVKGLISSVVPSEEDEVIPFDRVRRVIAERLTLSKLTIPHYYVGIDVDVENALKFKEKFCLDEGTRVSFNDILVWVTARVLKRYRWLNAHVDQEQMIVKGEMNIGIAVSTPSGLLVPVLARADQKVLTEISAELRKLAEDARRGIVNPSNQGTFTISNLGMFGISTFLAIINPPECAVLSVGGIEKKVIPTGNGLKITDMVHLGLAIDHRAVDGAYAAQFLNELKRELMKIEASNGSIAV